MPVALPSVIDTTVPNPDLEAVMLFCLAGLTVSSFLGHLLSAAAVEAAMLLACAG